MTHNQDSPQLRLSWFPRTIVSGGQTGADRAALDWAIAHYIEHGGWCPKGRLAIDGPLAPCYHLTETESAGYLRRTKLNVQDSDATLIFNTGALNGGTLKTIGFAVTLEKPHHVFQLDKSKPEVVAHEVVEWLKQGQYSVLNIAGPREEKRPGIYPLVMDILDRCLALSTPTCG